MSLSDHDVSKRNETQSFYRRVSQVINYPTWHNLATVKGDFAIIKLVLRPTAFSIHSFLSVLIYFLGFPCWIFSHCFPNLSSGKSVGNFRRKTSDSRGMGNHGFRKTFQLFETGYIFKCSARWCHSEVILYLYYPRSSWTLLKTSPVTSNSVCSTSKSRRICCAHSPDRRARKRLALETLEAPLW